MEKHKGSIPLLKEMVDYEVISFHQEAPCAHSLPPEFNEVVELVVKIVNAILLKGLNH